MRVAAAVSMVLALGLGGGLTVPAQSAEPSDAGPVPAVKTVHRHYGDGSVYQDSRGQRVRIAFDGRRGDRVRLGTTRTQHALRQCDRIRLTDGHRALFRSRSGFWTLPRRGEYVFVFTPCDRARAPVRLQLTKLLLLPLTPAGLTTVPERKGFVYAVDAVVPPTGTLVVRPTDESTSHGPDDTFFTAVLPPTGKLRNVGGLEPSLFLLAAGRGLETQIGPITRYAGSANLSVPAAAGDHYWILLQYDAVLRTSTAASYATAVDATTFPLATSTPGGVHLLELDATEGQWLSVDRPAPSGWLDDFQAYLTDARGLVVEEELPTIWRVPASGHYRLTLIPNGELVAPPGPVAVRAVRNLGALPADGTPTTFATTYPGEPVLATVTLLPGKNYRLAATAPTLPTGWSAWAACGAPRPPGCTQDMVSIFGVASTSFPFTLGEDANPYRLLFLPGLGQEGSVQLAVTPEP